MKLFDRLLNLVGFRRYHLSGAIDQKSDLRTAILAVRSRAYFRITGKKLVEPSLDFSDASDIKDNISPSRRLARRSL